MGFGDPVFPGPQNLVMTSILKGVEEVSWSVYPVETIVAEKLHALIDLGEINSSACSGSKGPPLIERNC